MKALLRSYQDKSQAFQETVCKRFMFSGATIMSMLHYCGNMGGRAWGPFVLFAVAYSIILHERLHTAFDPDEEFSATKDVLGEKFSRRFHAFYPFIDTRTDFTRTVAMKSSEALRRKSDKLLRRYQRKLLQSIALVLPLLTLFAIAPQANFNGGSGFVLSIFVGLLLSFNYGPVSLLDNIQRVVAMAVLMLPLKSIQSIKGISPMEQWDLEGELPKSHYNHFHSHLKSWGGFLHNKVYKVLRKEYSFTIGKAMAATVLAKAAVMTFALIMLVGRDAVGEVNTNLYGTLLELHFGYYLHACYMYLLEDEKLDLFKSRAIKRDSKAKSVVFGAYRIGFGIVDHLFYTQPLMKLAFQAVASN